jgi:hypothetical protein
MGSQQVLSGVTVTWNDAKHSKLNVKDGPHDKRIIQRSKNNDDEFTPSRIVIDLKLDLGDTTVSEVKLDDVHLQIAYSGTQPTIGWWNGAKWVKFKQVAFANHIADITLPSPWPTDPLIGSHP